MKIPAKINFIHYTSENSQSLYTFSGSNADMQVYTVVKDVELPKQQPIKTIDTKLEKETADDSLEKEVTKEPKEDTPVLNTKQGFTVYFDKNGMPIFETYNSGGESFYNSDGKEAKIYYELMKDDEKKELAGGSWTAAHVVDVEQKAQKTQQDARESVEYGHVFARNDGLTKYEQTDLVAAHAAHTEAQWLFRILNQGWARCLYDMKNLVSSSLFC